MRARLTRLTGAPLRPLLCLLLTLYTSSVNAETDPGEIQRLGGAQVLEVLAGLALIIVIIFGLARLLQKMNGISASVGRHIKIVAGLPLGSRERILLLQVADKHILIAATAQSISPLHVFDDLDLTSMVETDAKPSPGRFASLLSSSLKRSDL